MAAIPSPFIKAVTSEPMAPPNPKSELKTKAKGFSYQLWVMGGERAGVCVVTHGRDEQRAATEAGEGVPDVPADAAVALADVAAVRHAGELSEEGLRALSPANFLGFLTGSLRGGRRGRKNSEEKRRGCVATRRSTSSERGKQGGRHGGKEE